jgi:hypothetical protein
MPGNDKRQSKLEAALEYAKEGYPVLPLKGKLPLTKHGYKDASCDEAQIRKLWRRYPDANIGIVTGDTSQLFVLDVDTHNGKRGEESLVELEKEYGVLPKTLKAQTASGAWHYVFRLPKRGIKSNKGVRDGIDLLANGSYFVASPSMIDGKAYQWVERCGPAPCPSWLASLKKEKSTEQPVDNRIAKLVRDLFQNGKERNSEWETRCPFHDDHKPSFYVNLKDGMFFCHSCDEKGSFETLYAKVKNIPVHEARRILRPIPPFIEELNKEHAIVKVGGKCAILNEEPHPTENWITTSFSSRADFLLQYQNRTERVKGKQIPVGPLWLNHLGRRQYRGIDFAPPPKVLRSDYYNLWQGFAVEPKPGDWSLTQELIHDVAARKDSGINRYILGWMAQAVQQPGLRLGTALVFRGKQGTGKGCLITEFGALWGPHFFHAHDPRQLTGNFNAHLKAISIVFADEAWANNRMALGVLKARITEELLPIEFKGKDTIQVKNYIRLMMATNERWAVEADGEERRFAIFTMGDAHMQDRKFFGALREQNKKGGREAFLHYLLNYDISQLDLGTIPQTDALLENKLFTMDSIEKYWYEILERGTVFENDPLWTTRINKDLFYRTYAYFANKSIDNGDRTGFWMAIRDLCPHIRDVSFKGKRCVEVGNLQQCRAAFDRAKNWANHVWDAPEVENDVPLISLPLPSQKQIELEEYDNFDQFRSEGERKGDEASTGG